MQTGRGIGMMTMNDALLNLLKKKLITPEEAIGRSFSRSELRMSLERYGIKLNEKQIDVSSSEPGDGKTPPAAPS